MFVSDQWRWKDDVQAHLRETQASFPDDATKPMEQLISIDEVTAQVIIAMHGWIRRNGGFNYRDFAKVLWHEILHRNGGTLGKTNVNYTDDAALTNLIPEGSDNDFEEFARDIVASQRAIDSSKYLLPEVSQWMPQLIEKYGKKIRSVVLWSTGDTETGFQNWKIAKSGLARAFIKGIVAQGPGKTFVEGVHYQVDSHKLRAMAAYIDQWIAAHEDEVLKLVVLDDSAYNLHMIEDVVLAEEINGKRRGSNVKFIPLHVDTSKTPSRGKSKFTRIGGIDELLASEFENDLDGAHLFVDFDDTLFKNALAAGGMQREQSQAIFAALVRAQVRASSDNAFIAANKLVHIFHRIAESDSAID